MEEDPMTGTISKLPGKLDRLLRQGSTHGSTLPKGVADEVPLIKGDLEKFIAISSHLEAMTTRCWRKEMCELSDDMEDPMTGSISKLPWKLDRLLRHGCTLPKGMADEIPLIKADLQKIVAISSDLEDEQAMTVRCWRKEVRELSYDIEDFVDQYEHAHAASCSRSMILGRKIAAQQRRKRLPWLREKLKRRLWVANKIREFSRRTQEALQRHSLYNLDAIAGASASSRRTCAYSGPAWNSTPCGEYVGISDAMEELSVMMMNDDHGHQKLKAVSIVGLGGIGKTTLATELYRKLGQQFECRAFVRTSQKPDMRRIFISMLSQVRPHQPPDNWMVHSLISAIRTHLQDKRYLIVVEDLCTASTWDIVKYALPDSNCCSRILTTTEIEDLALQSCDHDPKYVYKMKPLGEDNSRELFFGLVFGPQHECPPELMAISCNIIRKCGGLPLAIVTVASILSSQPGVQGQWDYVNKSIGENLLTNPTWEGMKQVLDLSYNNLPQHLKACILYTSLYEEDIIIWKDDLVNQWIAEGFIQTTGGQDKREIGRFFFDRLISGKLILPVDMNSNGEVLSCVVHHMILNIVIKDKSMEENFVTAIHHSQTDTTLADKVRRLSLQFGNAEDATPPSNMILSHVRTLAFSGVFKCLPSIEQFRLLQVLILHFWGDKDIISFDINRISELFRLRYLKVTSNVTLELGNQMRCLQSLKTLAIDARVSAVPSDIVQLPGLLHLRLPAETNLPNGIGHMTSLHTLGYFDLSSNSLENVQSLSMLTNLRDLQLTCSTKEPESLNMKTPFLLMNMILERLSNLKSLTLVPTRTSSYYTKSINDDTGATCITISDGFSTLSSAPALLQGFVVSPRICIFFCTPKWIGQLHKLSILKFGVRKIDRDGVDALRGLPALAVLSLYVHTKPAARIVIGNTGFLVIKYFKLKCCDPCLEFEEGSMPNLRKLKLAFNACNADQPSTMPMGIKYLSELKEVSAKICGAEEPHTRTAELAFRDVIRVHARCQSVNVQCVKQIISGEDDNSSQSSMTTAEYPRIQYPPSPAQCPGQNQNRHQHWRGSIPREFCQDDGPWTRELYKDSRGTQTSSEPTSRNLQSNQKSQVQQRIEVAKKSPVSDLREKLSGVTSQHPHLSSTVPVPKPAKEVIKSDKPVQNRDPPPAAAPLVNKKVSVPALEPASSALPKQSQNKVDASLYSFLKSLDLEKYLTNFQAEEVDMKALVSMTDKDLKSLGIPTGPRKKILSALLAQAQQPQQAAPPPPPPHQQFDRYESQKRRDWNTFGQYLRDHRPPLTLERCSGAHVLEFLRYLDQFGNTKVHTAACPFFGHPAPPAPCPCPLRQGWPSLDALVGRLRTAYVENGGTPDMNPFGARAVRLYLREVRDHQARARGIPDEKKKRKKPSAASAAAAGPLSEGSPPPGPSGGSGTSASPQFIMP